MINKYSAALLPLLLLAACDSTPAPFPTTRGPSTATAPGVTTRGSRTNTGEGTTYRGAPPDSQTLYQNNYGDNYGRSANSGMILQRGGVVEDRYIGNQRMYPGQSPYSPPVMNGNYQPGYAPTGTTGYYDPASGAWIPVQR